MAGKSARGGLVRALLCSEGVGDESERWSEVSGRYRLLLRQAMERKGRSVAVRKGNEVGAVAGPAVAGFGSSADAADAKAGFAAEMGFAGMLMKRVRYFTAGAVIGSRECVERCFEEARYRFGSKRKKGAKRMRGEAKGAAGVLWCARDCA